MIIDCGKVVHYLTHTADLYNTQSMYALPDNFLINIMLVFVFFSRLHPAEKLFDYLKVYDYVLFEKITLFLHVCG